MSKIVNEIEVLEQGVLDPEEPNFFSCGKFCNPVLPDHGG